MSDPDGRRRNIDKEKAGPHFLTFGLKTRRAFLSNLKVRGGSPL